MRTGKMWSFILLVFLFLLGGCLWREQNHGHPVTSRGGHEEHEGCGPAHHWNGHECVHNGHGHGDHDEH